MIFVSQPAAKPSVHIPAPGDPGPFLSTRKIFTRWSQGLFKELNLCVSLELEKGQGKLTRQLPVYPKLCPFCATPAQGTAMWRSKFPSPTKKSFRIFGTKAMLQQPRALSGKQLETFLLEKPAGKAVKKPKVGVSLSSTFCTTSFGCFP